jgi:hypothetical protein
VLIFTPWSTASGLTSAGALECLAASISYAVSYVYMDKFLAPPGHRPGRPVGLRIYGRAHALCPGEPFRQSLRCRKPAAGAGEMTNGQTAAGHAEPANRMKTEESSCDDHDCALS